MLSDGEASNSVDLNSLLVHLSDYMSDLSQTAGEVEASLSDILTGAATLDVEAIRTLQKLDFIRQALEDTSALAAVLSKYPDVRKSDLEHETKLGATQAIFDSDKEPQKKVVGDPELF